MTRAAIILCGGQSTRMGRPKAWLPFGPETMLARVVRLIRPVVGPVVLVAALGQEVPPVAGDVILVRDRREARGPLEGLAAGLTALPRGVEAAYVTSCDVPLLVPAFVKRMFDLLREEDDIAAPHDGLFPQPLAAIYRPRVLPEVESLLAAGQFRLISLVESCRTREVPVADLRTVDPELLTLMNCNRPEDYEAALARGTN
jgi:molybdopterin-guanine dinucleotide biosynthesis protein A